MLMEFHLYLQFMDLIGEDAEYETIGNDCTILLTRDKREICEKIAQLPRLFVQINGHEDWQTVIGDAEFNQAALFDEVEHLASSMDETKIILYETKQYPIETMDDSFWMRRTLIILTVSPIITVH